VGRVPSEEAATALAQQVRSQTGTAFVVRLDARLDPAARPAEATREAP
jgi:hypothetical protein